MEIFKNPDGIILSIHVFVYVYKVQRILDFWAQRILDSILGSILWNNGIIAWNTSWHVCVGICVQRRHVCIYAERQDKILN